ncbi:hypothetical protein ACSV5M_06225 [Cellvibrio sp. ARAG 10.3]|uniref:hypothetical protein n=1 Tax=Cellvibrio sp. ARAG 10.3 TaxID=3451358 RepID=UPI003F47B856
MSRLTQNDTSAISFAPVFTQAQFAEFEQNYNANWGTKRRLLMLTLSRSSDELLTAFDEDGGIKGMAALMEQIKDYEEHLKAGLELVESATARLFAISDHLGMLDAQSGDSEFN